MANVLGNVIKKGKGAAGAVELFIDGVKTTDYTKVELDSYVEDFESASTLPYNFHEGKAVTFDNNIHILGSHNSGQERKHYKWDGTSWTSVSTLPYSFYNGAAVVYNNEIHILGGSGGNTSHYKWDGISWTSVSTLPYNFYYGAAVVYNNGIHILGSLSYYRYHYKSELKYDVNLS